MTTVDDIAGPDAERAARAVKLAIAHRTYEEIAQLEGYPTRQAARQAVMRALRKRKAEQDEDADVLVARMVEELEEVAARMRVILDAKGVLVRGDQVVTLEGEPVIDHGPAMQAADRLLRVQERLAKLKGLDAPTKIDANMNGDMTVRYTYRGVDPAEV